MKSAIKALKQAWHKPRVMCSFNFQVHIFDLWLNKYMIIGFSIITVDNCETDRSLLGIFWQPQIKRIWISVCFINFRVDL
jgi:hypothetical protein